MIIIFYQFISNLGRRMTEWADYRRARLHGFMERPIDSEVKDIYGSYRSKISK